MTLVTGVRPMIASAVDGERADTEAAAAVEAAVRFVAMQPGGARRILGEHHRRENGCCAGCLTSPVRWPCMVGVIATKALQLDVR